MLVLPIHLIANKEKILLIIKWLFFSTDEVYVVISYIWNKILKSNMCNVKENHQANRKVVCNKALGRERINFLIENMEEQNVGDTPAKFPWT